MTSHNFIYKQAVTMLRNSLIELTDMLDSDKPIDFKDGRMSNGLCFYVRQAFENSNFEINCIIAGVFELKLYKWAELNGSKSQYYPIDIEDRGEESAAHLFDVHRGKESMWRGTPYAAKRRSLIDYIIAELNKELQS